MKKLLLMIALIAFLASCGGGAKKAEPAKAIEPVEEVTKPVETTSEVKEPEAEPELEIVVVEKSEPVAEKSHAKEVKKKATIGEWTGYICALQDYIMDKPKKISIAEAKALRTKGRMLAFITGDKAYIVYSTSGVYAGKRLVKKAGKNFTIKGKLKNVGGMQIIIADSYN
jgi:hypothetical protein